MKVKSLMRLTVSTMFFLLLTSVSIGQTKLAISIDDVPNTRKFELDNFQSKLLENLDSVNIPISIFINEGLIYKTDSVANNFELLNDWVRKDFTTLGNHTFSHPHYSQVGFDIFSNDIKRGQYITKELANKYKKSLKYFRFPFNDLGKDSVQHVRIDSFLSANNYISTPFTIESSDWMFNFVYEYYLKNKQLVEAKRIGDLYVAKTLEYFSFFESMSLEFYGRKVNQIYLCHDNSINADYLVEIIDELKKRGVVFCSLDQAMEDQIYSQTDEYYRKWGVSWFYRWMLSQKERIKRMRLEPDLKEIETLYTEFSKQKSGY